MKRALMTTGLLLAAVNGGTWLSGVKGAKFGLMMPG